MHHPNYSKPSTSALLAVKTKKLQPEDSHITKRDSTYMNHFVENNKTSWAHDFRDTILFLINRSQITNDKTIVNMLDECITPVY